MADVNLAAARAATEEAVRAALAAKQLDRATELALRGFGPEVLSWMHATLRDDLLAGDAFALFSEELWKSLHRFDGGCSVRTWAYMLARHVSTRVRDTRALRNVPLSQAPLSGIAAEVRESTLAHLRTEVKDRVRALREQLDPDDQTLLILRVDRDLGWRDIALVMLGDGAAPAEVARLVPTLRKRFERVKARLRELAAAG